MIFHIYPKIIHDLLNDQDWLNNAREEERNQLINLTNQCPSDLQIKVNSTEGKAYIEEDDFKLYDVSCGTFIYLERLAAEYKNRLYTIKSKDVDKFLNLFAKQTIHKKNRLPYPIWNSLINTKSDINFWEDEDGNIAIEIDGLLPFRTTQNPVLLETISSINTTQHKRKSTKKEKENHFMNFKPNMNFDFGPCGEGIALSPYGLAIQNKDTWITYNPASNQTIDVNGIIYPMKGMIYKMPVAINAIRAGDMIIHQGKPMYIISVNDAKIEAVDILASETKNIIPVTNMFGFNFVTKVISIINFGTNPTPDQPFGNLMPLMMASMFFGEDENPIGGDMDFGKMMMMSMMMGGAGNNPFANMFNLGMAPTPIPSQDQTPATPSHR